MELEVSTEDKPEWMQAEITLNEEFQLEEGLRYVLKGCDEEDQMDLLKHLIRENFAAQKIVKQASAYIDGLEAALLISIQESGGISVRS